MITIYNSTNINDKLILEKAELKLKSTNRYGENKIVTLAGETIIQTLGTPDGTAIIKESFDLTINNINQAEYDKLKYFYKQLLPITIIDQLGRVYSGCQITGNFNISPTKDIDNYYYKGTITLEI